MIEINLLPDVKQEFIRAKRMRNTVISVAMITGLAAGGLVVLMLVLLGIQVTREALADKGIDDEYAKLQGVEDLNELVTLQEQLANIGSQHDNKTITSRLFRVLEAINPAEEDRQVQFSSVQLMPGEKTIVVEGTTSNGFMAVESMAKTIQNTKIEFERDDKIVSEDLASSIDVGDTSLRDDADGLKVVAFSVRVEVNEVLFSNQAKKLETVGPRGRIDVTDSRIGVPESLFTQAIREEDDE